MKKGKLMLSGLALFIAIGAAYAFKLNDALPGNLWYVNSLSQCVKAPCETSNNSGNACKCTPLYSNSGCTTVYSGSAWTTVGGQ